MNSFNEICFDNTDVVDIFSTRSEYEIEVGEDIMNWYYSNNVFVNSKIDDLHNNSNFWKSVVDIYWEEYLK